MKKSATKRTTVRKPAQSGLTAKQKHALGLLSKNNMLEPLLRDLAANIASAKVKH